MEKRIVGRLHLGAPSCSPVPSHQHMHRRSSFAQYQAESAGTFVLNAADFMVVNIGKLRTVSMGQPRLNYSVAFGMSVRTKKLSPSCDRPLM